MFDVKTLEHFGSFGMLEVEARRRLDDGTNPELVPRCERKVAVVRGWLNACTLMRIGGQADLLDAAAIAIADGYYPYFNQGDWWGWFPRRIGGVYGTAYLPEQLFNLLTRGSMVTPDSDPINGRFRTYKWIGEAMLDLLEAIQKVEDGGCCQAQQATAGDAA